MDLEICWCYLIITSNTNLVPKIYSQSIGLAPSFDYYFYHRVIEQCSNDSSIPNGKKVHKPTNET